MRTLAHALLVAVLVGSCIGDELFTVGGEVSGLVGRGLVLTNDGIDDLTINANGRFVFGTQLLSHEIFFVTVKVQPPGQACSLTNGAGQIEHSNITNIVVACGPDSHPPAIAAASR